MEFFLKTKFRFLNNFSVFKWPSLKISIEINGCFLHESILNPKSYFAFQKFLVGETNSLL